jgi:ABC-type multidrug transport system fused ATPase/permease subunit|eukprot:COSAG02_NODE_1084_length_14692_cov_214.338724_2_plen_431_part_00
MHVAGPESPILCGAALWLVLGSTAKLISTNSQARMMAAVVGAAVGTNPAASADFKRHLTTMIGMSAVSSVTSGFRIWSSAKAEVLTVARLRRMLFTSLLSKDIATFDTEGTGELTSRLSSDVTIIGTVLSTNVNIVLQQGFTLIGSLVSLYRLSPRLALFYMVVSAVWVSCTKKFGAFQQMLQRIVLGAEASMSGVAEQAISMIRLVRTSGSEWFEREKYYKLDAPRVGLSLRNKMGWALYVPVVTVFQNGLTLLVLLLGGRMVLQGRMSGSDFAAFMLYSEGVQGSMGELAGQVPAVMTALGAGEKVFELIALQPTIPSGNTDRGGSSPDGIILQGGTGVDDLKEGETLLAVTDVRFAYAETKKMSESDSATTLAKGPEVLKGLSLEIAQGEMVALVSSPVLFFRSEHCLTEITPSASATALNVAVLRC